MLRLLRLHRRLLRVLPRMLLDESTSQAGDWRRFRLGNRRAPTTSRTLPPTRHTEIGASGIAAKVDDEKAVACAGRFDAGLGQGGANAEFDWGTNCLGPGPIRVCWGGRQLPWPGK